MTKLPFQTKMKKDFRNLQESILIKDEAYDNYCALRLAQKSVLEHGVSEMKLEEVMNSLECFKEYSIAVLLLDFVGVNVITLNKVETEVYISVLKEKHAMLKGKASDMKHDKEKLDELKDEIWGVEKMLLAVKVRM